MCNFVSFPLFGFALVIKVRNFNFQSYWNILIFFNVQFEFVLRLIRFKLRCLSRIFAISWEIWILNMIGIVIISQLGICCEIKICPTCFCLICIFRHYYRYSIVLKRCSMFLRYIKIIYSTFCVWSVISGCCPRTNKSEMTCLVIDGNRHWLSIQNLFRKTLKWKEDSAQILLVPVQLKQRH